MLCSGDWPIYSPCYNEAQRNCRHTTVSRPPTTAFCQARIWHHARGSVNYNAVIATTLWSVHHTLLIFWHFVDRLFILSKQETRMHVIKIARFDWSAVFSAGVVYRICCQPCLLCKLLVQETCMDHFWCYKLVQFYDTRFLSVCQQQQNEYRFL